MAAFMAARRPGEERTNRREKRNGKKREKSKCAYKISCKCDNNCWHLSAQDVLRCLARSSESYAALHLSYLTAEFQIYSFRRFRFTLKQYIYCINNSEFIRQRTYIIFILYSTQHTHSLYAIQRVN